MAHSDFKPLYKAEYTSQGTLINDVFPDEVRQILGIIKAMENKQAEGVEAAIGWMAANMPPYKKYFKDYDKLQQGLDRCRELYKHWRKRNPNAFPNDLKKYLYFIYEKWWEAYNESGAGIRGRIYDPQRNQKAYDAITGKKDPRAKAFYESLPGLSV